MNNLDRYTYWELQHVYANVAAIETARWRAVAAAEPGADTRMLLASAEEVTELRRALSEALSAREARRGRSVQ